MSVTTGDANTDAILTTLSTLPTTFNNSLAGAVDINAAFTLSSGYLVGPPSSCLVPADLSRTLQSYRASVPAAQTLRVSLREDWCNVLIS